MTIDGTVEIVAQSANTFGTGDIIAIIISIIAFIGVIVSNLMTNRTMAEIHESNKESQEKWNQKNIDATLIAHARIEWIQNVRNTTAELLALYFEVLNTVDKELLLESVTKAQEKTELLILFFGHEEQNSMDQPVYLLQLEDNVNKNDSIVEFLSTLSKQVYQYYKSIKSDELNILKDIRSRRIDEMQAHIVGSEREEYEDEHGNVDTHFIPMLDERYEYSLNEIEKKIKKIVDDSKIIMDDLLMLRDIIRIYLKNEWNKAKKGV